MKAEDTTSDHACTRRTPSSFRFTPRPSNRKLNTAPSKTQTTVSIPNATTTVSSILQ